jgi:phosphopantetheine adenylyltransferase
MEQEKAYSLLNRLLIDIVANAERILSGNDNASEIESFARYSIELKEFVVKQIESRDLKNAICEIPNINYKKMEVQFCEYLFLPAWLISIYKNYLLKQKAKQEIELVKARYSNLQMFLQSKMN